MPTERQNNGGIASLLNQVGVKTLLVFTSLSFIWLTGFMSRLFSVIRYESIIHEFDPWFNYRATHYMVTNGFYNFLNWFDESAWYPLGRIVGGTVYPGLMVTSGAIHWALNALNITIHIREVCVFLAPFFSGLTAIATYLLTKELWSQSAGLLAAAFIAIVPGLGKAHFPAGQIGDAPHRIYRLISRPGTDENIFTLQNLGLKQSC